jgi:hypothetical protein
MNSNGQVPEDAPPQTIVDPEFVIPHLTQRFQTEIELLNRRVSELLYENSLKSGYVDQLKKELADCAVRRDEVV